MKEKKLGLLAVCLAAVLLPLGALPPGVIVEPGGKLNFGDAKLEWVFFGPQWRAERNPGANRWRMDDNNGVFHLQFDLADDAPGRFSLNTSLTGDPPPKGESVALMLSLPAGKERFAEIDGGRRIVIPAEYNGVRHPFKDGLVKKLSFELSRNRILTITGRFHLLIQDNRQWGGDSIEFRLHDPAATSPFQRAELKLSLSLAVPALEPLSLENINNMGFRDEVADDGKGGWTDQGPENDLRALPVGVLRVLGLAFPLVDPERNDGRSCLVLSTGRQPFPAEAELPLTPSATATGSPWFYLLHASAWTPAAERPIGTLRFRYHDGSIQDFPVISGRDCGNWWQPSPLPNGAVAWSGANTTGNVGFYLSQFELSGRPESVRWIAASAAATGNAPVWMVLGAALGDRRLDLRPEREPVTLAAGKQWLPVVFDGSVVPGSPLDFSGTQEAPAGKFGAVIVTPAGHFAFRDAPEKRIRFLGLNLVGSTNFLDRAAADKLVRQLVMRGYNSVRFHHFENDLMRQGAADSLTFDPVQLDRFFYLFAELKKKGIYLCLDLYASRQLRGGDGIPEREGQKYRQFAFEMKTLVHVSPEAMANWKEFARRLLCTTNPYTGLTLAEDPALYSLNLVNEGSLPVIWEKCPETVPLLEKAYAGYLKSRGLDTPENRMSRLGLFSEFLNGLQCRTIDEQTRFLRDELKLTALITDLNFGNKYTLAGVREKLDFVDNHFYWDIPSFPAGAWRFPYVFRQGSSIGNGGACPRQYMATRLFGKPYTVTEFNFWSANRYRAEEAPLVGGYAALQDWDGLYRFAWSHDSRILESPNGGNGLDIVHDPQAQLSERIIAMLFLRGDVSAAREAFAFDWSPDLICAMNTRPLEGGEYPEEFSQLGLFARIGTLPAGRTAAGVKSLEVLTPTWEQSLPADARAALTAFRTNGVITSETGEITLSPRRKTMRVVTPKSEVLTAEREQTGRLVSFRSGTVFQTVALLSLEDRPLSQSSRALLIHLTNLSAAERRFEDANRTRLTAWGKQPLLLERGSAEVTVRGTVPWKVEALKLDGSLNGTVPVVYRDGQTTFSVDTARAGGTMVYLLTRR